MKIRSGSYFLIVIMVIMLATIGGALSYPRFATKLLPVVFASLILVLAMVEFIRESRAKSESDTIIMDDETGVREQATVAWSSYLVHGSWVAGFALGIYLLGFLIAIPIFLVAYMRRLGTGWRTTILVTIVLPGILYALFERVLHIILYRGLLLTWLGF